MRDSFGGFFYVFLRALSASGDESQGIYFRSEPVDRDLAIRGQAQTIRAREPKEEAHEAGGSIYHLSAPPVKPIVDVRLPRSPERRIRPRPPVAGSRKSREPLKALYSVEDEIALIAWELARWQPGLGLLERQALILLVLTVLVHLRQGSTRIRLRGDQGRSLRLDLASRLLKEIDSSPATPSIEPVAGRRARRGTY